MRLPEEQSSLEGSFFNKIKSLTHHLLHSALFCLPQQDATSRRPHPCAMILIRLIPEQNLFQ